MDAAVKEDEGRGEEVEEAAAKGDCRRGSADARAW